MQKLEKIPLDRPNQGLPRFIELPVGFAAFQVKTHSKSGPVIQQDQTKKTASENALYLQIFKWTCYIRTYV